MLNYVEEGMEDTEWKVATQLILDGDYPELAEWAGVITKVLIHERGGRVVIARVKKGSLWH